MQINVPVPSVVLLTRSATQTLDAALSAVVDTPAQYDEAATQLMAIKGRIVQLEKQKKEILTPMREAEARIRSLFAPPLEALQSAEAALKSKMSGYTLEARKRDALAKEEADRIARAAREEAQAKAAAARAEGLDLAAQAHELVASMMSSPAIEPEVPKVAGISTRITWSARVTDKRLLIAHVAAHPELLHLLDVNLPAAHAMARSLREQLRVPGLEAIENETVVARGAA